MNHVVNLRNKLATFTERWSPRIVAEFNDNDVMVVKVKDEFVWHSHPDTDDLFLVIEGELDIEMRDRVVTLQTGELFVVPRGIEHRPVARKGEATVLIMEPRGTPNTGDFSTAATKVRV